MRSFVPVLQLVQLLLVAIVLLWDVVLTGRISQVKTLPRLFVLITALAGFLLLPALVIHLATADAITGRSVTSVDWLWPATVVLFAIQALYAAVRRLVNPFLGFFIATYNVMIAADAVLRFIASRGTPLPGAVLVFLAATSGAFAFLTQSSAIIGSPFFFFVPISAPAFPSLRPSAATFRFLLASTALLWVVAVLSQALRADQVVNSYGIHDPRVEPLQERPSSDFEIGLKIFPDLGGPPPPLAIKNDLALVDSLDATIVNVIVIPERINAAGLDSLSHSLDELRGDSTTIVVTLGYSFPPIPLPVSQFSAMRRLAAIGPILRRLRPDVLLPALDPYDAGARAAGARPAQFWEDYLTRAAEEAHKVNRRIRIGVSASSYDRRDSTLYAWAAAADSPIDIVGFTLFPSANGVKPLDAARGAADRWMREAQSTKDHWVFSTGGYPEAHGEASQERAVWSALAWATSRPAIKALIVNEAGDYGTIRGVRAADGHLRRVAFAILRAQKGLRETAVDSTPKALKTPQRIGGA